MPNKNYNTTERLLHYLALGLSPITEMSFDLEQALRKHRDSCMTSKPHVFVAGLARAGTTILMKAFYDTGRYRSLTYRDMPFVLMPNTWRKITSPFYKHKQAEERSHGDSIMINYDSPEALDEVFWRIFAGDKYLLNDRLKPHQADDCLIRLFRVYVDTILQSDSIDRGKYYLSKNNNNILRLPSIRKAFPKATILVPYRDPVQHALSLQKQHEKFLIEQQRDPFSLRYMTWLSHHEFGLGHRPFIFNDDAQFMSDYSTSELEYWLIIWTNTYNYLLECKPRDVIFVAYEDLCADPARVLGALFEITGLSQLDISHRTDIHLSRQTSTVQVDRNIRMLAQTTYAKLREQTLILK